MIRYTSPSEQEHIVINNSSRIFVFKSIIIVKDKQFKMNCYQKNHDTRWIIDNTNNTHIQRLEKSLILLSKGNLDYEFKINANNKLVRLVKATEEVLLKIGRNYCEQKKMRNKISYRKRL